MSRPHIQRLINAISILFIVGYLIAATYLYLTQEQHIFPRQLSRTDHHSVAPSDQTQLTMKDGTQLDGFYHQTGSQRLLIYFDGNSDNVKQMLPYLAQINDLDSVGINYRGYGDSQGEPSQTQLYQDALAIYDHYAPHYQQVYLLGRSLGSAIASYVSSQRNNHGVLLVTPFDSILALAHDRYPIFPLRWLLKYPFDNIRNVTHNPSHFYVLMVTPDLTVPNAHTQRLLTHIQHLDGVTTLTQHTHGDVVFAPAYLDFIRQAINHRQ